MKLFFRLLSLSLLLLAGGSGVAFGDNAPSVAPLTLTQGAHDGGRIYLPVRFANVQGMMRLDTGASTSRVGLAPWNRDFPTLGQSGSTGVSGETARCEDVEARNVEIRATQGNGVARARYEVTRCPSHAGDDLLGLDFFKGARFSLDFGRREMVFFGKPLSDSPPMPFRLLGPDQRLVGVGLRLGNTSAVGLFDTGAELCAVDQRFVERHPRLFTPVKSHLKASEASGARISTRLYRIRQLDFGAGHSVKGVYALAYDFSPLRDALGPEAPVILGYNLLSKFDWDLDFTAKASPNWRATPRK